MTVENREIIARTMGEFESLDEIRNVVVSRNEHGLVYLKDVATVDDFHEEARVITRFNGENGVSLSVLKQAEANTVEVARRVKTRLDELRGQIPEDIRFGVVENQGDYVLAAIHSVRDSAIVAAILVILVTFAFLGQWRQVVVMVVALPLTLVANFVVMWVAGFSLNVFSLGGLVVAMGVVLDNSIVAVENITRLKREGEEHYALRGLEQVGTPILAATLSFLALVLPFLLVPGLITLLFKELVMAVAGVVVISLLMAWTLTPLVTDRLLRGASLMSARGLGRLVEALNDGLAAAYGWILRRLLRLRWLVVLAAVAVLVAGALVARRTGSEFLPEIDDGRIMVKIKGPDLVPVYAFAQKVASELRQTEGLTGVNISMDMTKPEYRIHVDRARASALGIPVREVAETLRSLVHGAVATQYRDGSEYYDIRVMVPETQITGRRDLEQLVLESQTGTQHYLHEIAEVRQAVGPVEIVREDQAKQVIVRADSAGVSVGEATRKTQAAVTVLEAPPGVYFEMGGQAQMMADMIRTAYLVLGFAVFFAFVVLAVQFESLRLPLLVLACLPVCLVGMVGGLYVTGLAMGATVAIGVLIVVSAIANDGTLLLSFAVRVHAGEAEVSRCRPVFGGDQGHLREALLEICRAVTGRST